MDKKKIIKNSPIGYVIPQMKDNDVGLRSFEKKFKGSDFASSMWGYNVKDVIASPTSDIDNNVTTAYEPFRDSREKKISNQQLIRDHGTIYPEFLGIEGQGPNSNKNTKPQQREQSKVEQSVNMNFEIKSEPTQTYTQPTFSQPQETRSTNFNSVNFEQPKEDYSSKETKLPPFLFGGSTQQSNNPFVEKEEPVQNVENNLVNSQNFDNNIDEPQKPVMNQTVELKSTPKKPYKYPPLSLFAQPDRSKQESLDFLQVNKEIIDNTLKEFHIDGTVTNLVHGPTVSRYEISLAAGVNVKKIPSIQDTIRMKLSAKTIRILAPIPGKSTVGIEVPNRKAETVHFIDIVNNENFLKKSSPLTIALGKDIDNTTIYQDIARMPHGLVAGASGSGKSVCVNTLLISLLLKNSPDELRLILIDPKVVELGSYDAIPHLITPVITDPRMAAKGLKWAVEEMDKRYLQLRDLKTRNIDEYNKAAEAQGIEKMPFILIVIDELSDLMQSSGPEVEDSVQRIAQKARAAGIHLIVATQRPTTDVVKGTIKANIPTRIAFRVSSGVDSTTILDQGGAENLLGSGDMLIKDVEGMIRVQGAYIKGDDIDAVTNFIRNNNECSYAFSHDQLKATDAKPSGESGNDDNELLHSAATFFIHEQNCSINALQRQFNLGFNRSQKVVDQLEKMGIVSPRNGTLAREVLVSLEQLDEIFNK
ncbi:MAG: DNA translocase FtsK [bacterium]